MTPEAKLEALAETGIDYTIVLDFDKQLSELSAREFIRLIRDTYGVRLLLVGYDHRFGHNRSDTFADYVGYGRELGVEVMQTPELDTPLGHVSSSVIRRLVAAGNVALAAQMLSRPYRLEGTVVGGFKNGRKLGYPTANIALADRSLLLPKTAYMPSVCMSTERFTAECSMSGCVPLSTAAGKFRLKSTSLISTATFMVRQ